MAQQIDETILNESEADISVVKKKFAIFNTNIQNGIADLIEPNFPDNPSWEMFANSTIIESEKQKKVREYYFESESTEVISSLFDIAQNINDKSFDSIFKANMLKIAKRYVKSEKTMIEKKTNMSHPSPCNIFTYLENEDNVITFFISKIDIAEYFDSNEELIKHGLPHNKDGKRTKNWKTAKVIIEKFFNEEENYEELKVKQVIITDTNPKIADYWFNAFLEATELTDDVKNTKEIYKFFKKLINKNGGQNKSDNVIKDNNHYLNQLNGYMINNKTFEYEEAINHIFGEYKALDTENPIEQLKEKIDTGFNQKKFDKTFNIIHNEIKEQTDVTYKISEKISLKLKYIDNIEKTVRSKLTKTGEPVIEIKVDSVENKVYKQFLIKDSE